MSQHTKIEWCDSTINPVMGCDGCELWSHKEGGIKACYAGELTQRYGRTNKGYPNSFDQVTEFPGRMDKAVKWKDLRGEKRPGKPWLNGLPRHIFISDMADALSKAVGFEYLYNEIICPVSTDAGRRHKWLWLTKVPSRMVKFSEWLLGKYRGWPDNLMAMTSITSKATVARLDHLLDVRCKFRGVSFEPLWGDVGDMSEILEGYYCQQCKLAISWKATQPKDFEQAYCPKCGREDKKLTDEELDLFENGHYQIPENTLIAKATIDWAIVGGQSGSAIDKPMYPGWAQSIRDQCCKENHRIPFFFKQWGMYVPWDSVKGSKVHRNHHVNGGGRIKLDTKWPDIAQAIMHRIPNKGEVRRTLDGKVWSEMPTWKLPGVKEDSHEFSSDRSESR